jgi:hypothetical protein
VVAVLIEAFGRAMPTLVLACSRGVPWREVRQQRPRTAMQPGRLPRAVKVLAVIEVVIHPAHEAIKHVTGAVASGVMIRLRPTVAFAAKVQDVFQNDPRQVFGRPFPERPEPLRETPAVGRVVRLPDPPRNLREHFLQMLSTVADFEPRVQETQEDDQAACVPFQPSVLTVLGVYLGVMSRASSLKTP